MKKVGPCSIEGCAKQLWARGLCGMHYRRQYTHGDPLTVKNQRGEAKKFYDEVVLSYEGSECLIWPHARIRGGYGNMSRGGRTVIVSRVLCQDVNGPPPTPRHEAAHSCGNGKNGCVTKGHLSWKTPKANQADKLIHGTLVRGERQHGAKLTESQAREILSLKGTGTQIAIAEKFGVGRTVVSKIHRRVSWAWMPSASTSVQKELGK